MDESHQDPSSSLLAQKLLEELESLIFLESERSGTPWISAAKLNKLFYGKCGLLLEEAAKIQGYSNGLRDLLKNSGRFSIYDTQISQEFYIALFLAVIPGFRQIQVTPIQYRIKRAWKVDGRLLRILKTEYAEESLSRQDQNSLKYQPNLISEIKSVKELEVTLTEIIKSLTENNPKKTVTIAVLSKKFCDYYKQPIRVVVRCVCPGMKLIELLQTIPSLHVQKVGNEWQARVDTHSIE